VNFDHKPSCVLVTGKKGSGKTTYWLGRLVAHRAKWKFIFDPTREVATKLKLPICIDHPQMTRAVIEGRPVCYDSSLQFPGERREGFAFFSRYVFNVCQGIGRGVKLICCDELQSVQRIGDTGLPAGFKQIIDEGRREELDCLFASQRINEVNDDVRGQITEIITFKHDDPLPLKWLAERGFDPAAVSALPAPGGWIRRTDTGEVSTHAPRNKKSQPAGA
jgi:hypothetical protein